MGVSIYTVFSDNVFDNPSMGARSVAKDGTGRYWIGYDTYPLATSLVRVRYSDDGGSTWTEEDPTNGATGVKYAALAVDAYNRVHVFWNSGTSWMHNVRSGGTWGTPDTAWSGTNISDKSNVYAGPSGKVHFIGKGYASSKWNWVYARYDDATREESSILFAPSGFLSLVSCAIAEDSSGDAHAIWCNTDYGTDTLTYKRQTAGVWGSPSPIQSVTYTYSRYVQMLIDGGDQIHVVTGRSPTDLAWEPYVQYCYNDGSWQPWETVSSCDVAGSIGNLDLGLWIDGAGVVNAAWCSDGWGTNPAHVGVFYSRRVGGSWGAYEELASEATIDNGWPMTTAPTRPGPGLLAWRRASATPQLKFAEITVALPPRRAYAYSF